MRIAPVGFGAGLRKTVVQVESQRASGVQIATTPDTVFVANIPKRVWFRFKDDDTARCYRWEVDRKNGREVFRLSAFPAAKLPEAKENGEESRIYTEEERAAFLDQLLEELENLPDSPPAKTAAQPEKPDDDALWTLRVEKKMYDYLASDYDVTLTSEQGWIRHARRYDTKRKAGNLVMDLENDLTMQNALSQIMGIVGRVNQTLKRINLGEFPNLTDPD